MKWPKRCLRLARFILFYIREIIISNFMVAYDLMTPTYFMKPGVIAMPLDVESEFQIFLVANLITMTPGTLTIDISSDRKTLYVHAMYINDLEDLRSELKHGIEAQVIRLFKDD